MTQIGGGFSAQLLEDGLSLVGARQGIVKEVVAGYAHCRPK
jgi:hypothetical protein